MVDMIRGPFGKVIVPTRSPCPLIILELLTLAHIGIVLQALVKKGPFGKHES